ncbi:hypothetical protein B0E50_04235 [Rhodanobacter sp. C01]|nr:hypothetical protein B0E50_04235 [Rhodanobacter sp. C01]
MVVLIGFSIALVGVTGGVVFMGSFAMDSPTSTAGTKVDIALKILGSILTVWFAPAHEVLKIMGAGWFLLNNFLVEAIVAPFFWALLVPLGLYFARWRKAVAASSSGT